MIEFGKIPDKKTRYQFRNELRIAKPRTVKYQFCPSPNQIDPADVVEHAKILAIEQTRRLEDRESDERTDKMTDELVQPMADILSEYEEVVTRNRRYTRVESIHKPKLNHHAPQITEYTFIGNLPDNEELSEVIGY